MPHPVGTEFMFIMGSSLVSTPLAVQAEHQPIPMEVELVRPLRMHSECYVNVKLGMNSFEEYERILNIVHHYLEEIHLHNIKC